MIPNQHITDQLITAKNSILNLLDQNRRKTADAIAQMYNCKNAEIFLRHINSVVYHNGGSMED